MLRLFLKTFFALYMILISNQIKAAQILNFNAGHNVTLDGEWYFSSDNDAFKQDKIITLPNSLLDISGTNEGTFSFEQQFVLPKDAIDQVIYMYIPYQYGAYEMYVDERLLVRVGIVGDQNYHQTEMAPKLVSFVANQQNIKLKIKFSNFRHIRGGLENSIYMGYSRPILHQFYDQIIPLCVLSGVLLMIASFMMLFGIVRKIQRYPSQIWIYLGLFILCLSLRSFFAVPFIYTLFTDISWLWGTRLEYLLTECVCLFFISYIYHLPHRLIHKWIYFICSVLIVINMMITLTTEPYIFQNFFFKSFLASVLLFANLIYGVIIILRQGIAYSKVNAIAISFVCLTFLNDYLLALKLIDSVEIAFYGSCIYFVLLTFQLSRDYASQAFKTEVLNKKLLQWNKNLDQTVKERTLAVTQLNEQLALQVRTDALTGAFNRHALNLEIQHRHQQAALEGTSLAFYMVDVDYFKRYNDYYGHLKGDDVLKRLVTVISEILPESGFVARYGGEEFAVLLSDTDYVQAQQFAQRLCEVVRNLEIEHANRDDEKTYISISVGGAFMDATHIYHNVTRLMKTADQKLYVAKIDRDGYCMI